MNGLCGDIDGSIPTSRLTIRGNFVSILMPNSLGNTAQSSACLHWAFFPAAKVQLAADGSLPRTLERRPPIAGSMELFGRSGRAGIRLSQPDIGVRLRDQSHQFVPADRQVHRTQVDGCHRHWHYKPAACGQTPIRVETSIATDFWVRTKVKNDVPH